MIDAFNNACTVEFTDEVLARLDSLEGVVIGHRSIPLGGKSVAMVTTFLI